MEERPPVRGRRGQRLVGLREEGTSKPDIPQLSREIDWILLGQSGSTLTMQTAQEASTPAATSPTLYDKAANAAVRAGVRYVVSRPHPPEVSSRWQ